jgi:hypothetical protein
LEARMVVTTYNPHVRLLSPGPWLVGTTKVYPGVGADIVMESIALKTPRSYGYGHEVGFWEVCIPPRLPHIRRVSG